jgi:hypothetical protein
MAKLTIEGLTTEQAETLADWYEGQGEQDAGIWFEDRNVPVPYTDVAREGGYLKKDKQGNYIMYIKPQEEK